jgi:hypothetical protein
MVDIMKTNSGTISLESLDEIPNIKSPEILMKWTIKALPQGTLHMDIGMALLTLLGLVAIANGAYENYFLNLPERDQSTFLSLHAGIVWTLMSIYMWALVVHQKTIYSYTITKTFGLQESKLHFPEAAGTIFKFISFVFLIFIIGLAIYEKSLILMLAGPAGMAVVAAKFFLSWENTPKTETSADWKNYKYVTVDKKRKIILAQETEFMVGFEAKLPSELFDRYLETLRSLLPASAIFTEADMKW